MTNEIKPVDDRWSDDAVADNTIYLVTSGDYSDYTVNAVFSSRDLAEAWIARMMARRSLIVDRQSDRIIPYSGDDYHIEEQALNPELAHPVTAEHGAWVARQGLGFGGTSGPCIEWRDGEHPRSGEVTQSDPRFPQHRRVEVKGYGETPEHAVRAVRELERAIKAGTIVIPNGPLPADD